MTSTDAAILTALAEHLEHLVAAPSPDDALTAATSAAGLAELADQRGLGHPGQHPARVRDALIHAPGPMTGLTDAVARGRDRASTWQPVTA